jgi:hypothetical protein
VLEVFLAALRLRAGRDLVKRIDTNDWKRAHAELVRIGKQRGELDREEGRWLLIALRAGAHRRMGFGTFTEYVERVLGHGPRTTEEKVRVAEALERMPQIGLALEEGLLHWSAVRELTRVADQHTEAEWICAARGKTVREIERLVSGRRPGDRPSDPAKPEARRHVLRLDLSAESYAIFREAVAKLRRESSEPLDDDAAILAMARQVLGGPTDAGRSSYQVAMTVCESCRAGTQQGRGEAIPVGPEVVEMAECDAQRIGQAGARATQTIPPAVRRQVMLRHSGRCAVPGCRSAVFLDCHHVDPRAEGGSHDPEKLVVLCGAHHRAVHTGALVIDGCASEGFAFRHADGSTYGQIASPPRAERCAKVFQALRNLGFKETESRRAIDDVSAHVGGDGSVEELLRKALARLGERTLRVSDSARPSYFAPRSPRGRSSAPTRTPGPPRRQAGPSLAQAQSRTLRPHWLGQPGAER